MESVPRRSTDDKICHFQNLISNLRNEDVTIHYVTEHRTEFTNYLLAAAGIKSPNVARDVQTDEAEHDSVLAAAGTKVQEVAGDVQMTDTRADEAKRGITIKTTGNSLSE